MDEELLISLVQKYPELYDLEDPCYHNDRRRMNSWKEIAGIMRDTPYECKDKWKKIRENFRKANILRKTKNGKNFKPIRYSQQLSFLMPYIQSETESRANLPIKSDDEQSNMNSRPSTPGSPAVSHEATVSAKSANKKIRTEEAPTSSQSLFQPCIENKFSREQQEEDPVVNFFKTLGQTVLHFPADLRVRVKRDVFNIVSEAEEECIQRNDSAQSGGYSSSSSKRF